MTEGMARACSVRAVDRLAARRWEGTGVWLGLKVFRGLEGVAELAREARQGHANKEARYWLQMPAAE